MLGLMPLQPTDGLQMLSHCAVSCRTPATPLSWDRLRGQQAMVLIKAWCAVGCMAQGPSPRPWAGQPSASPYARPRPSSATPAPCLGWHRRQCTPAWRRGSHQRPSQAPCLQQPGCRTWPPVGQHRSAGPLLTVLRAGVTIQLMLGQWSVTCQAAMWSAGLCGQAARKFQVSASALVRQGCGMH